MTIKKGQIKLKNSRSRCGEKETLLYFWCEGKLIQLLLKVVWDSLQKTRAQSTIRVSNPITAHVLLESYNFKRQMYPSVHYRTICNSRRRQWHPTPVLLLGKSHGWRSLVGCSPWGREESDRLSDFTFTFLFHALEKEMATQSPAFLHNSNGRLDFPGPTQEAS